MRIQHRFLVLLAMLSVPLASQATPVWHFEGNCTDCAAAAGVNSFGINFALTLKDYTPGNPLSADNFVSFSYSGSNLVNDFVIDQSQWSNATNQVLNGVLSSGGGSTLQLHLIGGSDNLWSCTALGEAVAGSGAACSHTDRVFFKLTDSGNWRFGTPTADHGGSHEITLLDVNGVPEPATTLLLGAGLLGLGLRQRRASKRG